MASKTLTTRIKNRFDSLSAWQADGVELLKGEIALVSVATQQKDANGNVVNVPAVLMKVGSEDENGNAIPFNNLPWLSAKAADVYDWAKVQYAANIPVTFNEDRSVKETLNDYLVKVNETSAEVVAIKQIFSIVDDGTGSFVTDVTYDNTTGKFTISRSNVNTADIVDEAVTEAKLAADAVTTEKIKDGNVTDTKIAKGIDAEKILYTKGDTADKDVYLPGKIAEVESKIAGINTAISGGVHFVGITTTEITDGSTASTVKIDGNDYTANNGDVVIYKANAATAEDEEKEFIWVKPDEDAVGHWEALGDLSRVGALEDLLSDLPESARTANQYVTHIVNENGKLVAKKAQPAASEVSYSDPVYTTVEAKIGAIDAAIAEKADEEHSHDEYINQNAFSNIKVGDTTVAADSATDTVEFAGTNITITPDITNDKITFAVADGTTSVKGIVKLSDTNTGAVAADGSDSKTAATTKAVKEAYARGTQGVADASAVSTDLHTNYARLAAVSGKTDTYTMHLGTDTEEIIFDCGGAL